MILCVPPLQKQEGGLLAVSPVMHVKSCLSPSAAPPAGSEGERGEKNADYGTKTKLEKLVKLGIESHLLFL